MKPWMVGDPRGGTNGAKSVGKFLAPEIPKKFGDTRDAKIEVVEEAAAEFHVRE